MSVLNVGVVLVLVVLVLFLNVFLEDFNFVRGLFLELFKVMGFEES